MADQIEISLPKTIHTEGTNFTATVRFRTRATGAESIPTTIKYRIDNLTSSTAIREWTTVAAAAEVTILVTATDNAIQGHSNRMERKQILVMADDGLSTQTTGFDIWKVRNVYGIGS